MEAIRPLHITPRPLPVRAACGKSCFRGSECLLAGLSPETQTRLEQLIGRPKILKRGQRLFLTGETCDSLYLINSGSFKAHVDSDSGEEQITGFHFANDILGFDGLESGRHTYTVEALETSSVCLVPLAALQEMGVDDPALHRQLFRKVSRQIGNEHLTIFMLGRMNAEQRLAQFFLKLSSMMQECGRVADRISLSMPRTDIANYLGVTLETVCRLMTRFQNSGLLKVEHRQIQLLDNEGLHNIVRQGDEKPSRLAHSH